MQEDTDAKTVFVFPAAGGQKPGMGSFLIDYDHEPFHGASQYLGIDLAGIAERGPQEELNLAQNCNVAIYAQSIETFLLLEEQGVKPDILCGYSLGEYSALCAAGVFAYDKGLDFLYQTSQAYQKEFCDGEFGMAAVLTKSYEDLEKACHDVRTGERMQIYVSNMNLPPTNGDHGMYLISGERKAFMEVERRINGKVRDAKVWVPSHSPLVESVEAVLSHKLDELIPHERSIGLDYPVFSTMACASLEKSHLKEKMRKHLSTPVNWINTVGSLLEQGARTFVEVGPGKGLLKTVSRIADSKGISVSAYTTSTKEELEKILEDLPGR